MDRKSRFFVCDSVVPFTYPTSNNFHCTAAALSEPAWSDAEKLPLTAEQGGTTTSGEWQHKLDVAPRRSSMACYMQYRNVLDPAINFGDWSPTEDENLLQLVQKYDEHQWCEIAEELGTNRTPFECLRHYQRCLNSKLMNTKDWTEDEDRLLKDAVEEYGKGSWQQIASCIPGRTSVQCLNRWKKSTICNDSVVSGKWNEAEERLLFLSALLHNAPRLADSKKSEMELQQLLNGAAPSSSSSAGAAVKPPAVFNKWKDIAAKVPGKTEVQCREKWGSCLDPTVNAGPYAPEEDARLQAVVRAMLPVPASSADAVTDMAHAGVKWSKVASYLPGRTDASARSRYLVLERQAQKRAAQEAGQEGQGGGSTAKKRSKKK